MNELYPMKFKPVYKDYLWGNSRIPKLFNRESHEGICAESWEISGHPDGMSMVENGSLAGKALSDVVEQLGSRLLGSNVEGSAFPLLIKLIDAAKPLSVQVHPNNENAAEVNGDPKTEMWYFLNGDGESQVYCGFNKRITPEEFMDALENKSFGNILRTVPAVKGEAVFVPGGRVHAIDSGCLILEIQQTSNTTYRVYDWDRVDANGNAREMHVEQALKVIDFDDDGDPGTIPVPFEENGVEALEICRSPYFKLDRFVLGSAFKPELDGSSFHALFIAEGETRIVWSGGEETAAAGTSVLIPAALGNYEVVPGAGGATVLRTTVPA